MTDLTSAIADIYRQVEAPGWSAPNLDGLADVLRDMAWRAPGPVHVQVPSLDAAELPRLVAVLMTAEAETAGGPRPVRVLTG